jgi:hypothetical protein
MGVIPIPENNWANDQGILWNFIIISEQAYLDIIAKIM